MYNSFIYETKKKASEMSTKELIEDIQVLSVKILHTYDETREAKLVKRLYRQSKELLTRNDLTKKVALIGILSEGCSSGNEDTLNSSSISYLKNFRLR